MIEVRELSPELAAVGKALGVLQRGAGNKLQLQPEFFSKPGDHVAGIISNPGQRQALLDALWSLVPPEVAASEDVAGGERRKHPLLPAEVGGQLFLTIERAAAGTGVLTLGLQAEMQAPAGPLLTADLPLVRAEGSKLEAIAGMPKAPLRVGVRVGLGSGGGAASVSFLLFRPPDLASSRLLVRLEPASGDTLEFDPLVPPEQVGSLVAALLKSLLALMDVEVSKEVRALADHLPGLLGLTDGLPPLPIDRLTRDSNAMRAWLGRLCSSKGADGQPALRAWLDHLGQLLGAPAQPAGLEGLPTEEDPLLLRLFESEEGVEFFLTAGVRAAAGNPAGVLVLGARVRLQRAGVDAAVVADAVLLALPLVGTEPAVVAERVELLVEAPGGSGPLYPPSGTSDAALSVGRVLGGLRYRSGSVVPVLELREVIFGTEEERQRFPRLDLTDAKALAVATSGTLLRKLTEGLGADTGVSEALLKLLGLHSAGVDLKRLATAPTRAIAEYYRGLRARENGWSGVLSAVARLLGMPPPDSLPVEGTGRRDDPWRVPCVNFTAPAGALPTLFLALWDDAEADSDTPLLRLGLRLEVESEATSTGSAWEAVLQSELLGFDLPPGGGGAVRFMGEQWVELQLQPPPLAESTSGVGVSANLLVLGAHWRPGAKLACQARIEGLSVDATGAPMTLGTVRFPSPGFNPNDPGLGLGLKPQQLWAALRLLLGRAVRSWGGPFADALAALLGAGMPGTAGLPTDLPPLELPRPDDLGSLLEDPLSALRDWLASLASDAAGFSKEDGVPFLASLREPLQALLTGRLPSLPGLPLPGHDIAPGGAGTWEEPWTVSIHSTDELPVELLGWLEPEGPPQGWTRPVLAALESEMPSARGLIDAVSALSAWLPASPFEGLSPTAAATALDSLARALDSSDGVVSQHAALPAGTGWTAARQTVLSAHHLLPQAPVAIEQILARAGELTAGKAAGEWAVVLLAPPLAGEDCWEPLLALAAPASVERISLRQPRVDPLRVDLGAVRAASHYVVELEDDGSAPLAKVTEQLARVIDRIRALKPGCRALLVAHSYLGVVAQQLTSQRPEVVLGLVALGAPLLPVQVPALTASAQAEAVRFIARLAPRGLGGESVLEDALEHLSLALEGYVPGPMGAPPRAEPYPVAAFTRAPATIDLRGVPALAIAGHTGGSLLQALARVLRGHAENAFGKSPVTHAGYGVRVGLSLPEAKEGEPEVDVTLRLDMGRLALLPGLPEPEHPARRLTFRARLSQPDGWLLGGAGAGVPQVARVRAAELEGWIAEGKEGPTSGMAIRLHDAAVRGSGAPVIELTDSRAPVLLAELLRKLGASAPAGGRLATFLSVLESLQLIQKDAEGGTTLRSDAFSAVQEDVAGYLAPLLPALLDRAEGLLGLRRAPGAEEGSGPWSLTLAPLPVQVVVQREPWRVTVHTLGEGLELAGGGHLSARGTLRLDMAEADGEGKLSTDGFHLELEEGSGRVLLGTAWLAEPVVLYPAEPAVLRRELAPLIPRLLVDAALGALVERVLGDQISIAPLSGLLVDASGWLLRPSALGDGALLQPKQLNTLLAAVAEVMGLETTPEHPLVLPGGLVLSAEAADSVSRLKLHTRAPIELGLPSVASSHSIELTAALGIDAARHVVPSGGITMHLPLPGDWGALDVRFAVDAEGAVSLSATPTSLGTRLELLPRVSGLADLFSGDAQLLLSEVLDALVEALSAPSRSATLKDALRVAQALGVHDPASPTRGFRNRDKELAALTQALVKGELSGLVPAATGATVTLLQHLLGSSVVSSDSPTRFAVQLPLKSLGRVALGADLGTVPPTVSVSVLEFPAGPVDLDVHARYASEKLSASTTLRARIDTGLGLTLTPRLDAKLDGGGRLGVTFRPLGTDEVVLPLAPVPAPPDAEQLQVLAEKWILPLGTSLLLRQTRPLLEKPMWSGASAKSAREVLESAEVLKRDERDNLVLQVPLPPVSSLLAGALTAISDVEVPLSDRLGMAVAKDGKRYGLRLSGMVDVPAGDLGVSLRFGAPDAITSVWGEKVRGPVLYLLDLTESARPQLAISLSLGGLGLGLERTQGKPLVENSGFRLGGVAAYALAEIPLMGAAGSVSSEVGGAVSLIGLGLPLGATGPGGNNPVAASLLRGAGGGGDNTPVNPPLDLTLIGGTSGWKVSFNGKSEVRLPVRQSFGPLHVDEIMLGHEAKPGDAGHVRVGIDGSVSMAGLTVEVKDLSLQVPLREPTAMDRWQLDLGGLGVGLTTPAVSLAGGLIKNVVNGAVDYQGGISVSVAGRGITAIGAYSQPSDALGRYTSLFIFVSVSAPMGGPPYLFVLGLAGGAGYNRRLLVPRDPASVPSFPLVAAMSGGLPANPIEALSRISTDIAPSRGSYWVAAGIRFTTFELVRTQALVYASLDRGFEVGLLGLMQMALPTAEAAVVSVELAMAARFSTAERVLSVRAGLTHNSWLISRDCQLTGGFAFTSWFDEAEAVLTLGGYHPDFDRPAYYPVVPRVGFHWSVGRGITVKGGAYFALTPKALMLGGRLEASYDISPIRVWFTASLDVMVKWDPFSYVVDARVGVGATFSFKVCFFKCATIRKSVSLGANVHIEGPPLHARVTVNLEIASVTVEFGQVRRSSFSTWEQFRTKYLGGGDSAAPGTRTGVISGLRPAGTTPRDGQTLEKAWVVSPEFTLRVESRMPVTAWRLANASSGTQRPVGVSTPDSVDIVPAGPHFKPVTSVLGVTLERRSGGAWVVVPTAELDTLAVTPRQGHFPAALWRAEAEKGRDANLLALGSLEFGVPTVARERTGRFGDNALPFVTLVEEEPARRLPLKGTVKPLVLTAASTGLRTASAPSEVSRPSPPRLRTVVAPLHTQQPRHVRPPVCRTTVADERGLTPRPPPSLASRAGSAQLLRVSARRRPADFGSSRLSAPEASGEVLRPGLSQVWEFPERAKGKIDLRLGGSGAVRVTALSGTGAPLLDVEGPAEALLERGALVPEGTARLVIGGLGELPRGARRAGRGAVASWMAPAGAVPATGWQLHTVLLQVASGTLLAHGAIVLTPQPFIPPTGFRRGNEPCRVPADRVSAFVPGLSTFLPAETEVVVVQVDRRTGGSDLGDLVVSARGGELGSATRVERGGRLCLLYPVKTRAGDAPLEVSVASVADWRLAGVVGLMGTVEEWDQALQRNPHLRMVDEAPLAGEGPGQEISVHLAVPEEEGGRDGRAS